MKKALMLMLAVCMLLTLCACGAPNEEVAQKLDELDASVSALEEKVAQQEAAEPAPAAEEAAPEEAAPAEPEENAEFAPIDCEPLEITFNTVYNQTDTGGLIIQEWIDTLDKYSNGNISVNVFWGGTVYSDPDVLEALENGAIDMTTFGHLPHTGTLKYLAFPAFAPGGTQAALDYFNTLLFDDPETSALIQDEAAEHNMLFLNVLPGGANAYCTTYEFTDLDSMVSGSASFGNVDAALFEKLGFQVTSLRPNEMYDALQRGLVDATQRGLTPMVASQWYDVAPYWALDGTYTAGNFITANLTWWNALSADQQAIIKAASAYAESISGEKFVADIDGDIATVEEATGNSFVQFSDEDIDRIWTVTFEAKAAAAIEGASATGQTDGMVTILEKAAEITDTDWAYNN